MFHLERYARQRYDNTLALALKPHTGGCAVVVEQNGAPIGNKSLTAIERVESYASGREHTLHLMGYLLVFDE
jgi:hypothetical protein